MDNILPYPWQHPTYDETDFETADLQIKFCYERVVEAHLAGLPNVKKAWADEAFKTLPRLLDYINEIQQERDNWKKAYHALVRNVDSINAAGKLLLEEIEALQK